MLGEYIITFIDDEGNEDVISVSAVSEDAAAHYSCIPFDRIVSVELAMRNVKRALRG